LLEMARDHCPPAVKDIEHAILAATAGRVSSDLCVFFPEQP
jgi:hypothetical protein